MDGRDAQYAMQHNFALDTATRNFRRPNVDVNTLPDAEKAKALKRRKQKNDSSKRTKAKKAKTSGSAPSTDEPRMDPERMLSHPGLISMDQDMDIDPRSPPLSFDVSMPSHEPALASATHYAPPNAPPPLSPPHPVLPSREPPTPPLPSPSRFSSLRPRQIPPLSPTQPSPPPQSAAPFSGLNVTPPAPPSSPSATYQPSEPASVPQLLPPPRTPLSPPPPAQPYDSPFPLDASPQSPLTELSPSPELDAPPPLIDVFPEPDVVFSERSEYVTWCGKYRTRVPWISDPKKPGRNELKSLATRIKRLASHVRDASESPFIFTLDKADFEQEQDIAKVVKAHMAKGESVIVKGYPLDRTTTLEQKNLQGLLGCDTSRIFDVHDTHRRETVNISEPHIRMTLPKFLHGLKDERCIQCILDCPSFGAESPRMCKHVDEGHTSWPKSFQRYGDYYFIPSDVPGSQEWFIIHQALYHTYVHHDAEGFGTWTRSLCGHKFWVLTRKRDNSLHTDRLSLFQSLESYHCRKDKAGRWDFGYHDSSDSYLVVLAPGDIIFQAPGTWHEVYTPNKSVTVGGHFYTYDSLHLTEASRLYDIMHPFIVTNQKHDSFYQTIVRMVIAIPVRDPRIYYRKPLTALCRVVLCPYVHRPEDTPYLSAFCSALKKARLFKDYPVPSQFIFKSKHARYVMQSYELRAIHVAHAIVTEFSLDLSVAELTIVDDIYHLEDGDDYLFSSSPWMDPGEPLKFSEDFIETLDNLISK